jgi:hypothetical protein
MKSLPPFLEVGLIGIVLNNGGMTPIRRGREHYPVTHTRWCTACQNDYHQGNAWY